MSFERIERVADAILYEGYVLYPYRASAVKNQLRWQFGVVAPRRPREEDGEPWFTQTECLMSAMPSPHAGPIQLSVRVRFLRPQLADEGAARGSSRCGAEDAGGKAWLEGVPHAIDLDRVDLTNLPMNRNVLLTSAALAARMRIE